MNMSPQLWTPNPLFRLHHLFDHCACGPAYEQEQGELQGSPLAWFVLTWRVGLTQSAK